MAYLREAKQELKVDFSLDPVWEAIPKAVAALSWEIKERDISTHQLTIIATGGIMSYDSMLKVMVERVDEKTTSVVIDGETPVTTITATMDYGETYNRIDEFVLMLAKIMNS